MTTDVLAVDLPPVSIRGGPAATKYSFTVAHNTISDDTYGVWLTPNTVKATHIKSNHFAVTTPVFDAVQ